MKIDIFAILDGLEKVLPILGGVAGNPEIGILSARLLDIAEEEIQRRRSTNPQLSRTEILMDAAAAYAEAKEENARLAKLGHEGDS